jgi:hypothetical protein
MEMSGAARKGDEGSTTPGTAMDDDGPQSQPAQWDEPDEERAQETSLTSLWL